MKLKRIFALIALGLAGPVASVAQTALTQTTLSNAITSNQTTIQVASATGINAPQPFGGPSQTPGISTELVVDGEAMVVRAVSGTLITVQRGASGSIATAHNSGAIVWAQNPTAFVSFDQAGSCTAGQTFSPTIAINTPFRNVVHYWNCISSTWQPVLSTGTITPVATPAAIGTTAQTFTVKGLASGEPISIVSAPTPTSLCPLTGAAVTATNTVSLYFSTLTAAACTPASGTYLISVARFSL